MLWLIFLFHLYACLWLQALMDECDDQIEQTLDREETLSDTAAMLIGERNMIEKKLKGWLQNWPDDTSLHWLQIGLRPWHWPRLLWHYWQIQPALAQMNIILTQQAALQRQVIQNKMARQELSELIPIIRRVYNEVEEVGEMLAYLAQSLRGIPEIEEPLFQEEHPLLHLPTPHKLYNKLVPDATTEAMAAAAAIGGLGQQVTNLDDTVEQPLRRFGAERLTNVWQISCVEALMALLSEARVQDHYHFAWEAASPLWRMDEARLDEAHRAGMNHLTAVCGKNVSNLMALLPDEADQILPIEANDREYLWLIRVRTGLTLND